MGMIIPARKLSAENKTGLLKPIIYCCSVPDIEVQAVSLNQILAEKLVEFKPKRRTMQIEKCLSQVLAKQADGVVIKDFDVLFNPDYKIDVLKVMINVCKNKPFSVIWPGKYDDGKLYYAEEGYIDYKMYDVDDYDITCVI
jgi:hypothetical protein